MKMLKTRYLAPCGNAGPRVISNDGAGHCVMVPYDHELSALINHQRSADAWMRKHQPFGIANYVGIYDGDRYFARQAYETAPREAA